MNEMRNLLKRMLEISDEKDFEKFTEEISKFDYLITLDMGCGNTSAAVFPKIQYFEGKLIMWNYTEISNSGNWDSVKNISIPTIMGYETDEDILIGPEALQYGGAVENFKKIPYSDNLKEVFYQVGGKPSVTLRQLWTDYFKKVFEYILQEAKRIHPNISRENVIFVVARPADKEWEKYAEDYKKLIMKGTDLQKHQIITFSEAKAAMQYVRVEKKLELDFSKGIIVIDLGASTIDIEYRIYGKAPKEYSITMAGKDVDRLLGHEILSQLYPEELQRLENNELPTKKFFNEHMKDLEISSTLFAHKMRVLKENICVKRSESFGYYKDGERMTLGVDDKFLDNVLSTKKFTFSCNDLDIAAFMNNQNMGDGNTPISQTVEGTWYEHLEKLVAFALMEMGTTGTFADKIIVTGGTANLIGVKEHIEAGAKLAGWQGKGLPIVMLNQPADYERTVPYGSASYLLTILNNMDKMLSFSTILQGALKSDLLEDSAKIISKNMAPIAVGKVQDEIDTWADLYEGHPNSSINALEKKIKNIQISKANITNAMGNVNKDITGLVVKENLTKSMKEIEQFLASLSMNKQYNHSINIPNINVTLDPNSIMNVIDESFKKFDIWNYVKGVFTSIRTWLRHCIDGNDALELLTTRQNVKQEFKQRNTMKSDLFEPMKQEFEQEFDNKNSFGIVDDIIKKIALDIDQAMFIEK